MQWMHDKVIVLICAYLIFYILIMGSFGFYCKVAIQTLIISMLIVLQVILALEAVQNSRATQL